VAEVRSSDGLIPPPARISSSRLSPHGLQAGVRRLVCAAVAAALVATPLAATPRPENPSKPDGIVRIKAIVTDRRGQVLRNLKPVDFELIDDGQPQTVDAADYLSPAGAGPRTIAFLLDEFHTAPSDTEPVRESLLRFVDSRLRPGDSVIVVKPLDPLWGIKATTDREQLRQVIATFEGRKGDYTPRTVFERNYMAQAPEAVRSARAQIVTSALRAIGNLLAQDGAGQEAIVLVGDGFERSRGSRDVPANLLSAVRVINRADAAVYAFTPSVAPPPVEAAEPDPAVAALRRLVKDTGGEVFAGTAAFDAGFARMASDLDAHYVLTYRATHGSDGRFHALQVGVKRPDAQVRARAGYVAAMSATMRAALIPPPSVPLRVLRRSSLIQSWSGLTPADAGADVMLTWSPTMLATSTRSRAASVVITASAPDGTVLFDAAVAPVGEASNSSLPDHASFTAPVGAVRVDMKILDAKGVVLDTDARDVAVPKPRAGVPTLYTPGVLRIRSAREFRAMTADPAAAPTPIREFRRTEQLIIRVAALDAAGAPTPVTAMLLNRWRQPMREIDAMPDRLGAATQFDLPLANLAPGEYTVRLSVAGPGGGVAEHVTFRVLG
jgi:VWFA-related protein